MASISTVKAKDPTFVETTKVRANGMARIDRVWVPLDAVPDNRVSEVESYVAKRLNDPTVFPARLSSLRLRYDELEPASFKCALDHYMMSHGVIVPSVSMVFVRGVASREAMQTYLGEIAASQGYDGWEDYHKWYVDEVLSKEPDRGAPENFSEVWPVILSSFTDEGLQDGNHRLHQYMIRGTHSIPFIGVHQEAHQIKNVVDSWILRREAMKEYEDLTVGVSV